jgi:hypothetical protein
MLSHQPTRAALAVAALGVPIFPVLADKVPLLRDWPNAASCDPEQIKRWDWRDRYIGVVTGPRSGLAVLDTDPRNGCTAWVDANGARLPRTRVHATGGRGAHYVFRQRSGLTGSNQLVAPGVDVKAAGNFVIWWPADASGAVLCDVALDCLADWPEWIVPRQRSTRSVKLKGSVPLSRSRMRDALELVEAAAAGERNNKLFRAACRFGEMLCDRLSGEQAFELLLDAAAQLTSDERELAKFARTINSGLERGASHAA